MGKNLIQQARGKGSPRYRAPSFRYRGKAQHKSFGQKTHKGKVVDFVRCPGHSAPLAQIEFEDGELCLMIAPEGVKVGEFVTTGNESGNNRGNTLALSQIPEGTQVYNLEAVPGDGGKFVRSSGTFAKVVSQFEDKVLVMLPSKKKKFFNPGCRATIGVVAGGGRTEKPIVKAGKKHYMMKAKNKLYPKVSGNAQNAVDHPFGNSRSLRKSKAKPAPHNAPPGRKVGMIRPRHTGRNK
ncbi:MAG: 50S ribosomal protein L2 [Candidatus Woesearchaeota archaeon]